MNNDIRRTILWVIFGFTMVLLWDQWQVFNGHKATFFPTSAHTEVKAPATTANSVTPPVPVSSAAAAASPGSVLAVSGFAPDHGLTIIGALLLFAGCVSFGVGRKASRRQS